MPIELPPLLADLQDTATSRYRSRCSHCTLPTQTACAATSRCHSSCCHCTMPPLHVPPSHVALQAAPTARCPASCHHCTPPPLHAALQVATTACRASTCRHFTLPFELPPQHTAHQDAADARCSP
jgi:hypothetical protein